MLATDGVKAGMMDPIYSENDKHAFFHNDATMEYKMKSTFQCAYVGEHCYIWVLNDSITKNQAMEMGVEFDTNIYTAQ